MGERTACTSEEGERERMWEGEGHPKSVSDFRRRMTRARALIGAHTSHDVNKVMREFVVKTSVTNDLVSS